MKFYFTLNQTRINFHKIIVTRTYFSSYVKCNEKVKIDNKCIFCVVVPKNAVINFLLYGIVSRSVGEEPCF